MNYVYMVQFDWSMTDADGIEIELFADYDKAFARYKEMIANELDPNLSWVGDQAFNENGEINEDYELDEGDYGADHIYWHVVDNYDYYRHSFIDLIKKEVK